MQPARVLIVEDEPLIAMDLDDVVRQIVWAVVVVKSSVASAQAALVDPFDFAFLDFNVTNGDTLPLARQLSDDGVPFAFISATARDRLPGELQSTPFISKPAQEESVRRVLLAARLTSRSASA